MGNSKGMKLNLHYRHENVQNPQGYLVFSGINYLLESGPGYMKRLNFMRRYNLSFKIKYKDIYPRHWIFNHSILGRFYVCMA